MLTAILNYQLLFIAIGIVGAMGIISKAVSQITLKRLVKAASNMSKSSHSLIRLIRAKYEHACMVSDRVENVQAFVEKYIYEYHTFGMKLHTWRALEVKTIWGCAVLGGMGAGISYYVDGMQSQVLQYGVMGAIGAIMMFIVHMATDENYRMNAVQVYMVDYLENVCAHRYMKTYQDMEHSREENNGDTTEQQEKELILPPKEENIIINPIAEPEPLMEPEPLLEPQIEPQTEPSEPRVPREAMIREILQEFLA